jgi:hypothetical protein
MTTHLLVVAAVLAQRLKKLIKPFGFCLLCLLEILVGFLFLVLSFYVTLKLVCDHFDALRI